MSVGDSFRGPYPTRDEAVDAAHLLASLCTPSQMITHSSTGDIETETSYSSSAAWPAGSEIADTTPIE